LNPYGGSNNEPTADAFYIPLFLGKTIISSIFFILGLSTIFYSNIGLYSLITIEVLFFSYLMLKRPYHSRLMNIGAIACQTAIIYSFILPILHEFYTPTDDIEVLLLFVLQGMILLAEAVTFVRILKSYYNSAKAILYNEDK